MSVRIRGAGAPKFGRALIDIRDYSAIVGGDQNAASVRWNASGLPPASTNNPFWTPEGATLPVLTLNNDLGMHEYRLAAGVTNSGFFSNQLGLPLGRRYNLGPTVLPLGCFGPRLRWRLKITTWTRTPAATARLVFGIMTGSATLAATTGYEITSANGGPWEVRRRLIPAGAVDIIPILQSTESLTPQTWEWVYTEGTPPVLQLFRNNVLMASFSGQGAMPALNGAVVFGAFMPRWTSVSTAAGAVFSLLGGQYVIEEIA